MADPAHPAAPVAPVAPATRVRAWRPDVPGLTEVLHAAFTSHAYPKHTHDAWTVLLVDAGGVRYDLDRREHQTAPSRVVLLPPHVAHDGRAAGAEGFRKRVLYLDTSQVDVQRLGRAVDRPDWTDPSLWAAVDRVHRAVQRPGDELEAETWLAIVTARLGRHLDRTDAAPARGRAPTLARRLQDLLDAHVVDGISLATASAVLGAGPSHLVRAFGHELGISPHRYLVGRRVDVARRLLLAGTPPGVVAVEAGFHDQAHLTRHFRRTLGVTPAAYARSA
ncbi:AraC family transcriptional regulator [Nocardioides renjunii]|uniref:AraC family transcriptional regulator n=1 Tax=Nocardioides renjunii TaxID=3095075 RepID=UPI002AFEC0AD|nr:AraC family transcriptional regulator [Nocardioides sp. S-34]WQQ24057.1 AraC family transcriptional regulator [Nocardioides sp. S-34]